MWLSRPLSNIARPCRINRSINQSVNLSIHPAINRLSISCYHENHSPRKPRRQYDRRGKLDRQSLNEESFEKVLKQSFQQSNNQSNNRSNSRPSNRLDADDEATEYVLDADGNKIKKQKYALFIGYSGHGYRGLQKQTINPPINQSDEKSESSDSSLTSSSTSSSSSNLGNLRQVLDTHPSNQSNQPVNQIPSTEFIEGCLEDALYGAGYIRKENYGDLTRSSLSRSSRTDKGVSAAVAICSLKLLIPEPNRTAEHLKQSNETKNQLTDYSFVLEEVNKRLPADIRLLFIRKMPRRWNARRRVNGRTYRYVVPVSLLAPSFDLNAFKTLVQTIQTNKQTIKQSETELYNQSEQSFKDGQTLVEFIKTNSNPQKTDIDMDRLNRICKMFEGNHSMHNYTKLSTIKRKSEYFVRDRVVEDDDELVDELETDQPITDQSSVDQSINQAIEQSTNQSTNQSNDRSKQTEHLSKKVLNSLLHRIVHSMSAEKSIVNGVECVTFSIYGESFIYHQIRKMMAMVIAVYHDLSSPFLLEASLACRREIPVTLAPSLPLMLDFTPESVLIRKHDVNSEVEYPNEVIESIDQFRTQILMPKILENQLKPEGLENWAWFYYWLIAQLHFQIEKNPELMKQLAVDFEEAKIAKISWSERKEQQKVWEDAKNQLLKNM